MVVPDISTEKEISGRCITYEKEEEEEEEDFGRGAAAARKKEGCLTIKSTVTLGIYILQSLVGIHALSSCHSFLGMYLSHASRRYRGGVNTVY